MLSISDYRTIAKNKNKYLSFPDILQSKHNPNKIFIVYREADSQSHHPRNSKLILQVSYDKGKTWKIKEKFPMTLKKHGQVWNCPRLSYIDQDNSLNIVCDTKSGVVERIAQFSIYILKSFDDGETFDLQTTHMPGMVPDKIVKFKDNLYCANHKIKNTHNKLVQLVSWSRDNGKTWFDTNIIANSNHCNFCEASIINTGSKLFAYLRNNSGHIKKMQYTTSGDGIHWGKPLEFSAYGQRPTAIVDENFVLCSFRDTEHCSVSLISHEIGKVNNLTTLAVDYEKRKNQYDFGYTGLTKISKGRYLLVYYIRKDKPNPYIKLAEIRRD